MPGLACLSRDFGQLDQCNLRTACPGMLDTYDQAFPGQIRAPSAVDAGPCLSLPSPLSHCWGCFHCLSRQRSMLGLASRYRDFGHLEQCILRAIRVLPPEILTTPGAFRDCPRMLDTYSNAFSGHVSAPPGPLWLLRVLSVAVPWSWTVMTMPSPGR